MSGKTASTALKAAISERILGSSSTSLGYEQGEPQNAALFYDMDEFEAGLNRAEKAFGEGFLHAVAMKSNPVSAMMKVILEKGHGVECASIGELLHALKIGFPPENIVFDSPVKTAPELKFALERAILVNVDNYEELEVITAIMKELGDSKSTVGIRLNPLIGIGDTQALSNYSTFPLERQRSRFVSKQGDDTSDPAMPPLKDQLTESSKEEIIRWYKDRPWLTGVHVHAGSQSFDCKSLTKSTKCIVEFALEVNHKVGKNQISVVDIGGGLKVNTADVTDNKACFENYAEDLRKEVPELFPSHGVFKIVITEFGHAFNTRTGWLASRVEYTKMASENLRIVLIHFGADIMLRTCYCPNVQAYQEMRHNIAGPLCFSGDVIKQDVLLPMVERGDYIVVNDCGANCLSLFSRHCSRQAPSVIGYQVPEDGKVDFQILKEAETMEDLLTFWQGRNLRKEDD